MKTYWKSEAPENSYYIKYSNDNKIHEFWTDDFEHYCDKMGFIARHISYFVIESRAPLTSTP